MSKFLAAGQNLAGGLAFQREVGQRFSFRKFEPADQKFDWRDQRRRRTQFVHPQAQQEWSEDRVAGHLAAYADPNLMPVRCVHGGFDQPHDGRMRRLVKMSDLLVHPIDRQRILNQIVGADAEKLQPFRQVNRPR